MYYYQDPILRNRIRLFLGMLAVVGILLSSVLTFVIFRESKPDTPQEVISVTEASKLKELVSALPVRLVIPAIDVDANIQHIKLDPKGTEEMAVPSNFTDVGWYQPGIRPGMSGSAVITGHYNGKETPKAVFFDLDRLQIGDKVVIIDAEHVENIFVVVKIEAYGYDAETDDVFISQDGKKRLNLITCGGQWLPEVKKYDQRTVVFTELQTNVE